MHKHPQVKVQFKDQEIEVDEGLSELLPKIWSHDINTSMSCQENRPNTAWIAFRSMNDLEKFMNLIPRPGNVEYTKENIASIRPTLYGRSMQLADDRKMNWSYECFVVDYLNAPVPKDHRELRVSMRFPVSDIPLILADL